MTNVATLFESEFHRMCKRLGLPQQFVSLLVGESEVVDAVVTGDWDNANADATDALRKLVALSAHPNALDFGESLGTLLDRSGPPDGPRQALAAMNDLYAIHIDGRVADTRAARLGAKVATLVEGMVDVEPSLASLSDEERNALFRRRVAESAEWEVTTGCSFADMKRWCSGCVSENGEKHDVNPSIQSWSAALVTWVAWDAWFKITKVEDNHARGLMPEGWDGYTGGPPFGRRATISEVLRDAQRSLLTDGFSKMQRGDVVLMGVRGHSRTLGVITDAVEGRYTIAAYVFTDGNSKAVGPRLLVTSHVGPMAPTDEVCIDSWIPMEYR